MHVHSSIHIFCLKFLVLTILLQGFPDSSIGKESACNAGDPGSIPGLGRSPGEGKGYPLQYSGLENSKDSIVHGVTKKDMPERLSLSFFYGALFSLLSKGIIHAVVVQSLSRV